MPMCAEMHIDFHLKWSLELPICIFKLKWLGRLFMKFSIMQVHENLFISSQAVLRGVTVKFANSSR